MTEGGSIPNSLQTIRDRINDGERHEFNWEQDDCLEV